MTGYSLVLSSFPDEGSAEICARELVASNLAACVHLYPSIQSIYRWKGKIEKGKEFPLWIKTTSAQVDECISKIKELHPFQVPEILSIPIESGLREYLKWLDNP